MLLTCSFVTKQSKYFRMEGDKNWQRVHIRDCEIWKRILRLQLVFSPPQLFREATWT
jgi:hypothetical protein